jgi:type II secretory pathway component PulF
MTDPSRKFGWGIRPQTRPVMGRPAPEMDRLRPSTFMTIWPHKATPGQRQCVLRLAAVATEENLPLGPLIAAWAESERGFQVYRLRRLARRLESGASLADALEQVRGVLSDDEVLAVRIGSQSGTLASTLRAQLTPVESLVAARTKLQQVAWYLALAFYIGVPIVLFMSLKIGPEFVKILYEFGLEPTPIFNLAARMNHFGSSLGTLFSLALYLAIWTFLSRTPGRLFRTYILNPLLRPLRELRSANIMSHLATTLAAGRPVLGAVSTLAQYHFDPRARSQMLTARNDVEQGADLWSSLARRKVLSKREAAALATCEPLGNQAWMLKHLASIKRSRAASWCERAFGWLLPLTVLLIGCYVFIQAVGFFSVLIKLIEGLA